MPRSAGLLLRQHLSHGSSNFRHGHRTLSDDEGGSTRTNFKDRLYMKKSVTKVARSFAALLLSAWINSIALGQCYTDSPGCSCFNDTGAWAATGKILSIAEKTVGTTESCEDYGGKAFWQIQMGMSSPELSQSQAMIDDVLGIKHHREPWCSETIGYWHRMAGIPYSSGYKTWWYPDWQVANSDVLRAWYKTEELLGGRGRWISGGELSYNDFRPGVNGPCPGAYQQLGEWADGEWTGAGAAHSQMVYSMKVYKNAKLAVTRIDLTMIEGNACTSPGQICQGRTYTRILDYTTQGTASINGWKIRGWGVDLDADHQPIYDASKITYVTDLDALPPVSHIVSTDKQDKTDDMASALVAYNETITKAKADPVRGAALALPGIDPARTMVLKAGPAAKLTYEMPVEFPIPLKGLRLTLEGGAPQSLKVEAAGADGRYAVVRELNVKAVRDKMGTKAPKSITLSVMFDRVHKMKSFRISSPKGSMTSDLKISAVEYIFDWGDEDTPRNP